MWDDDETKGEGETRAHSLLFSKSTKGAAKLNVPIRQTNRYQQYYMQWLILYVRGLQTFEFEGHIILRAAVIADYKIVMHILNIIIGAWAVRQVTYVSEVPMT